MKWKINFLYPDGCKIILSGKKALSKEWAEKYWRMYGNGSDGGTYQQYPKKKYNAIAFVSVVDILSEGGDLEIEILKEKLS